MEHDKYAEAALQVAHLLGWTPSLQEDGSTIWIHPETEKPAPLPDWANDLGACLSLAIKVGLKIDCTDPDERFICYVYTGYKSDAPYVAEHYEDHKSRDLSYDECRERTTQFAILSAAMLKLEAKLQQAATPSMGI